MGRLPKSRLVEKPSNMCCTTYYDEYLQAEATAWQLRDELASAKLRISKLRRAIRAFATR